MRWVNTGGQSKGKQNKTKAHCSKLPWNISRSSGHRPMKELNASPCTWNAHPTIWLVCSLWVPVRGQQKTYLLLPVGFSWTRRTGPFSCVQDKLGLNPGQFYSIFLSGSVEPNLIRTPKRTPHEVMCAHLDTYVRKYAKRKQWTGMDGIHSGRFTGSRRPSLGGLFPNNNDCRAPSQTSVKKQAVKRHHHKHNLKHRYEFLETLGKGTYGKVKKARERSGRLVSRAPLTVDLYWGYGHNVSSATCTAVCTRVTCSTLTF